MVPKASQAVALQAGVLHDRVICVTGGAGGIGAAIARQVVGSGGKVVIGDVAVEAGVKLADELGDDATFMECDIRKEEDLAALVDEAVRQYGCLDVMVNNAGRMQQNNHTPLDQIRIQDFDATFKLNVRGALLGIMHAARVMKARSVRGCIINLGSISGMRGCSYEDLPYQSSKASIIALTRPAAAKLVQDHIRVNCVSPSMTRTPAIVPLGLIAGVLEAGQDIPKEYFEAILRKACPLTNTMIEPDEIAQVVVFLASDAGRHINGVNLPIDQGITSFTELP